MKSDFATGVDPDGRLTPDMLDRLVLSNGLNRERHEGVHATHALSWMEGGPHLRFPRTVCQAITDFLREWELCLEHRDLNEVLKPLLGHFPGTRQGPEAESRRRHAMADWLIRTNVPAWLDAGGMPASARSLRELPEIRPDLTNQETDLIINRTQRAAAYSFDPVCRRQFSNPPQIGQSGLTAALAASPAEIANLPVETASVVRVIAKNACSRVNGNRRAAFEKVRLEMQSSAARMLVSTAGKS